VGRKLARLPIDPRQARMIVEGERHGVAYEAAVIAAALSIQDPRERPSDKRAEADLQHRRFSTPTSDLLGYLNLWAYLRDRQHELSGSAFRRMCRSEFLNYLRVREWQDLVQQLRQAAKPVGIHIKARAAKPVASADDGDGKAVAFLHTWNEDAIHRSVLAGLLTQIGMQDESKVTASSYSHLRGEAKAIAMKRARKRATNEYLGTRGARFAIQPGSPLSKKPPAFVMAAQLVETNRLWARDVARIDPAWAEELAGDLAKHTYSEPHWSTTKGAAMAHEKVLLYGVPIVAERRILWGKVNPAEARELFIRHALVQGEWTTHHEFWKANQAALADAADLEARTRTFGLVAGEEELFDFYDERLPDDIVSASHFDRWWKGARRDSPDLLTYTTELLMPEAADVDPSLFPDTWPQGELTLPLTYQFEPGADADGVTVHIPLALLPRITPDGFDWLVPGMLPELTTATIRALPKPVRRLLVPAPDAARDIVAWMASNTPAWDDVARAGDMAESYRDAFTRATRALRDVTIPADAWDEVDDRLASHLKMTFRIVEHRNGRESVVDESTHLLALKRSLAPRTADAVRRAVGATPDRGRQGKVSAAAPKPSPAAFAGGPVVEKGELSTWPVGLPGEALPEVIESDVGGGVIVRGYPGLVEEKGGAALRILADARERDALHADGVRRLLLTECGLATKRVTSRWTSAQSLALAASGYRTTDALVADLQLTAIRALTTVTHTTAGGDAVDAAAVRSADAYAAARDHVRDRLEDEIHRLVGLVVPIAEASRALDADIRATTSMALLSTLADVRALASDLAGDGFLARTPPDRLRHVPRYLKAARHRIEKAPSQLSRDAELAWRVREMTDELNREREAAAASGPDAARATRIDMARWMIEEFRVSLFAQQLGTDGPVSEKRIRGALGAPPA
jgi:ATP-dependent helicase HrpA